MGLNLRVAGPWTLDERVRAGQKRLGGLIEETG